MLRRGLVWLAAPVFGGLLSGILMAPARPMTVTSLNVLQQGRVKEAEKQLDVYHFPVRPGMPEWKALKTGSDMYRVSQIPQDVLDRISTRGLVETVLNYPLLGVIHASSDSNIQNSFDWVVGNFNGLQALLVRKDAGRELLTRYQAVNPAAIDPAWPILQRGDYVLRLTYLELLLAQHSIIKTLTSSERRELSTEATTKARLKEQHINIYGQQSMYGQYSLEYNALILDRVRQHGQ